jgi:hypothetical protein
VFSPGLALAAPKPAPNFADQEKATIDKICAGATERGDRAAQYGDVLARNLLLSDDQKKMLKNYQDTQNKAIADAKAKFCADRPNLASFADSLAFRQKLLEQQLDTLKAVNPKLINFYNSLNDEQKAKFDDMRQHMASQERH